MVIGGIVDVPSGNRHVYWVADTRPDPLIVLSGDTSNVKSPVLTPGSQ
jgi:hypothetical protein